MKKTLKNWFVPVMAVTLTGLTTLAVMSSRVMGQESDSPNTVLEEQKSKTKIPKFFTVIPEQVQLPLGQVSDYWVGIQCGVVPPLLKLHLNLGEQEGGVLVESVVADSPATRAGIESTDILLKIGDTSVGSVEDIMKKVDAVKETEQTVTVIKKGEKKELKLTPAKRPEYMAIPMTPPANGTFRSIQPGIIIEGFGGPQQGVPQQEIPPEIQRLLEESRKQMEQHFGNDILRRFHGNIIPRFAPGNSGTVEQIQISIYPRQEDQPGGLTVKKNNQVWDVAKFEDLPKEVQESVKEILTPSTHGEETGKWIAEQIEAGRALEFSVRRQSYGPQEKTPQKEDDSNHEDLTTS
ncbi:MAG: PDZ domain-containing protein [Planctomycetaceae bacterium]|jgi:membrane-associated protease RseP (regulator of RpoE activity)|nr:PDZ domain-containing protein [Planctomycetaceae bacterium]